MPDAYDHDGGVNQEKRFSVAVERYRSVNFIMLLVINHHNHFHTFRSTQYILEKFMSNI